MIGGGDTAVEEALFLTRFADRIYLIHRRHELRASRILQERALANEKIEFIWDTLPLSLEGQGKVERLRFKNLKTGKRNSLDVNGVFIFVGAQPATGFLNGAVDLDEQDFIKVDRRQQTSVPGVFAAGDVVSGTFRQIATAVGEGASAIRQAEEYLDLEKSRRDSESGGISRDGWISEYALDLIWSMPWS